MPFQKGDPKRGGRQKGAPNKTTVAIKDAVMLCYQGIGGLAAFKRWARANPDLFYTKLLPKLIPHDVTLQGSVSVEDKRQALRALPDAVIDAVLSQADEAVH